MTFCPHDDHASAVAVRGRGALARDITVSRRSLLGAAVATGIQSVLPAAAGALAPARRRLLATTRVLEVNGQAARVFGLVGPDGRPGIRLAAGERFRVDLANDSGVRTLVHWHGQLPPWTQDGFPWPETPPIANHAVAGYDYAPVPGTYWMHSHHAMQEQRLMTAPLIVHDAAERADDRQEIVLMLDDFSFRTPAELLGELAGKDAAAVRVMMRHVEDAPTSGGATPAHGMARTDRMAGMRMPPSQAMPMDLNDVQYDAFLANDRTLADPEVVRVEHAGRIRLRVINGASSSQFWIDLGALTGRVVATDGHAAQPVSGRRFPLAMAQRLDILLDLPGPGAFPILAQLEGAARRTGIVLATAGASVPRIAGRAATPAPAVDHSLETRLVAARPLAPRAPDLVRTVVLAGAMKPYAWSMNGEYWPRVTPLTLRRGQRVEIELVNRSMMAHPIHLHGHVFQVVAINGARRQGAMRDTVLVSPMGGRVRIAFDADNPGRWPFHCHNLYHMVTGMMTELRYQEITA
jgi:FtsP/CotA-like multicopper oxidase with cupredoxin domain